MSSGTKDIDAWGGSGLSLYGGGGGGKSCLLKIGDPLRQTPFNKVNHSTTLGTLIPYATFFLQINTWQSFPPSHQVCMAIIVSILVRGIEGTLKCLRVGTPKTINFPKWKINGFRCPNILSTFG